MADGMLMQAPATFNMVFSKKSDLDHPAFEATVSETLSLSARPPQGLRRFWLKSWTQLIIVSFAAFCLPGEWQGPSRGQRLG